MSEKSDYELGLKVHEHLKSIGLETPMDDMHIMDNEKKIDVIKGSVNNILLTLGLDLTDDSLCDTPKRVAKMFVKELFWGLDYHNFPKCTVIDNKMNYDAMILEKCKLNSVCEHHLVHFGSLHKPDELGCWVAYIPKKKVVGLSKLSRIVDFFAHRPQVQERHTEQVAATLKYILETDDVAVITKAQHFCVLTRGVEDTTGYTITSSLHGSFRTNSIVRNELMSLIR